MAPTQLAPLLESSDSASYATVRPKPKTTIPLKRSPPEPAANEDYVVDIERIRGTTSPSCTMSSHYCSNGNDIFWCDYCIQNNLPHFPEHYSSLWKRCMESERSLAVLDSMIAFQMRLLSILVPLFLLFFLRIYLIRYIDDRDARQLQFSIFSEGTEYFSR
ncbi:hypothetical protein K449DRAFT_437821 [Hypoxylon sp. EC38]|nr:hypothetical protein K449DRAFT_437821 [Hypoxylon sp. EC38]